MSDRTYWATHGGHPPQTDLLTDRALFREAYAVIPRGTQRDIVASVLPFWEHTRLWVLARPLTSAAARAPRGGGVSQKGGPRGT